MGLPGSSSLGTADGRACGVAQSSWARCSPGEANRASPFPSHCSSLNGHLEPWAPGDAREARKPGGWAGGALSKLLGPQARGPPAPKSPALLTPGHLTPRSPSNYDNDQCPWTSSQPFWWLLCSILSKPPPAQLSSLHMHHHLPPQKDTHKSRTLFILTTHSHAPQDPRPTS